MADPASLCLFAAEPLDRASDRRADAAWIRSQLEDPNSVIAPLYKGDPLIVSNGPGFLSVEARRAFPADAPLVFLGVRSGRAHFAADLSAAPDPTSPPFCEIGAYVPLREAASALSPEDLAILGQARWLLDWHRRHRHCANCGAATTAAEGGAKRVCSACSAEHFPRSDPVAIVLAEHEDHCLLGRSPRFPPGFLSALAGFVEAAETPEACAARELREEAGVELLDARYQFSQPWPFPSSLMMGFIARAANRDLRLDRHEIEDARWLARDEIRALLAGEARDDVRLPPPMTIARRLIERWAEA